VCEIIEICLSNLTLQDPASFVIIEQLIGIDMFRRFAVRKLQQDCGEISKYVPKSTVLLVIECIKSPQVQIGPPAISLLVNCITNELLDDGDIKRELDSCGDVVQSEIKCRIYEVGVEIAVKGFSFFEKVRFLLDRIVADLQRNTSDDILLQMNLLEIAQGLCKQDYGLDYLEEKGILQNMARRVGTINDDPLINLLIPSLMKFFANIAIVNPQMIFNNYSHLVDLLFDCLINDEDTTLTYVSLDTLGNLCRFDDGKRSMDATFGERMCQVLSKVYQSISRYPSEIKIRAFQCLESVFYVNDNEQVNNQIQYILQKWIESVFSAGNFSSLLNYCNVPFEDLSLSAFGFLVSIVKHPAGQKKVAVTGGWIEFLLNRKIGSTHDVKQKRFAVIEILARSNEFNATHIALLNKYVREGANFVEPMSQVEFEPS
jgi:hypothetical protein